MMRRVMTAFGAIVMASLSGCGSATLQPAFHGGTAVSDPEIVGEWAAEAPLQVRAMIRPADTDGGAASYPVSLTVHEKGEFRAAMSLDLTLTQIESTRFADLFLARSNRDKLVGMYGFLAVPVHQIMKIERDGDTMTLRSFRVNRLEGLADAAPIWHERVVVGGGVVEMVTVRTKALRELLARNAGNAAAFADPIVFRRVGR